MITTFKRFFTTDGLELHGLLYESENKNDVCVIHVHGAAGNFYENRFLDTLAKEYTNAGYAFFSFNNRGCEYIKELVIQSGKPSCKIIGMLNEIFEDCIIDIDSAINFMKTCGYSKFILQGHSLGCNKVIYYALIKNFQDEIILLAPCDLARDEDPTYKLNVERAKQLIKSNQGLEKLPNFWGEFNITALTLISIWSANVNADLFRYRDGVINKKLEILNNKILIEIGLKDPCYSLPHQVAIDYLIKALPNAKLTSNLIEGASHGYICKEKELWENINNFLKAE